MQSGIATGNRRSQLIRTIQNQITNPIRRVRPCVAARLATGSLINLSLEIRFRGSRRSQATPAELLPTPPATAAQSAAHVSPQSP
ncbi:hypothetical protein HG66A1_18640 [Gimesia chilikensis]|uniref:Uncharacterized protein n=1 Tax=Gimesia chilikensis TaxID=2605989 RepID=A0A517PL26_9PLAN|nr:hypothetical protein HG66A1_18640 [Gimesia chilikensis]